MLWISADVYPFSRYTISLHQVDIKHRGCIDNYINLYFMHRVKEYWYYLSCSGQ
jgi:hypothetical protein